MMCVYKIVVNNIGIIEIREKDTKVQILIFIFVQEVKLLNENLVLVIGKNFRVKILNFNLKDSRDKILVLVVIVSEMD